jgi:hypothetical protein
VGWLHSAAQQRRHPAGGRECVSPRAFRRHHSRRGGLCDASVFWSGMLERDSKRKLQDPRHMSSGREQEIRRAYVGIHAVPLGVLKTLNASARN